jgi:Ino eighty subunit 2
METINKLLKKQTPKTNRKAQALDNETPEDEFPRADPVFVRWVSNSQGVCVAVPEEMLGGPAGRVFITGGLTRGKMVEEVS